MSVLFREVAIMEIWSDAARAAAILARQRKAAPTSYTPSSGPTKKPLAPIQHHATAAPPPEEPAPQKKPSGGGKAAAPKTEPKAPTEQTSKPAKHKSKDIEGIISGMAGDERKALDKGYADAQASGYKGSLHSFFTQQVKYYGTKPEGDKHIKTFFYGKTLDAYKALG